MVDESVVVWGDKVDTEHRSPLGLREKDHSGKVVENPSRNKIRIQETTWEVSKMVIP